MDLGDEAELADAPDNVPMAVADITTDNAELVPVHEDTLDDTPTRVTTVRGDEAEPAEHQHEHSLSGTPTSGDGPTGMPLGDTLAQEFSEDSNRTTTMAAKTVAGDSIALPWSELDSAEPVSPDTSTTGTVPSRTHAHVKAYSPDCGRPTTTDVRIADSASTARQPSEHDVSSSEDGETSTDGMEP
jgi:hypothetical protein